MTVTPMVGSTFFGLDISQFSTALFSVRRMISKRVLLMELTSDSLILAEATLMQTGVQLSHLTSFTLPPDALDRGVPAEPLKMAQLIQEFCAQKRIPAHRAAVVLPPQLAFQRLLELPESLTADEAREYVLDPSNGLQIPFPLTQTDFDIFPISTPVDLYKETGKRLYMLTAIPEVLVDPIVEMLQAADLELQLLELGSHSQLRIHAADLVTLGPQEVDLVLELLPDCSNLMLVSCSGLMGSERLAPIRNVPDVGLESQQLSIAVESGLSAEDLLFKDEGYLPISELDLRVLVSDLRASFESFHLRLPDAQIRRLILTGTNSSHPLLPDLLGQILGVSVVLSRSTAVTGLVSLSMDTLLLRSSLGRLIGLALGLVPNDQLLTCSLEGHSCTDQDPQRNSDAVAIADLLASSEAQTGLDLSSVEAYTSDLVNKDENIEDLNINVVVQIDTLADKSVPPSPSLLTDVSDNNDHSLDSSIDDIEYAERLSSFSVEGHLENNASESRSELSSDGGADLVGISPAPLLDSSNQPELELTNSLESLPEEEWPSITDIATEAEAGDATLSSNDQVEDLYVATIAKQFNATPDESESLSQPSKSFTPSSDQVDEDFLKDEPIQDDDSLSTPFFGGVAMDLDEAQSVIADLELAPETPEKNKKQDDVTTANDDSDLTDTIQSLGELRFADDD